MAKTALITGASGLLGRQVQRTFFLDDWQTTGLALTRPSPPEVLKLDITNAQEVDHILDQAKPQVIIHCAANRSPDSCTANPASARTLNVTSSLTLAHAALKRGILFIYISTDYVFSGRKGEAPYMPTSTPNPPNVYGQTKLEGETAVLNAAAEHASVKNRVIVLRVPVLYGTCDEPHESAINILMSQLWTAQKLQPGDAKLKVDDWARRYPTNTADVARVCRDLATLYLAPESESRDLPKVLHFSSEDCMTKWEVCKVFAEIMGLEVEGLEPFTPPEEVGEKGQGGEGEKTIRPFDCHLDTRELRELGVDVGTVDFRTWWRREIGAFRH